MPEYTMHLELSEIYTCEYKVEAGSKEEAKEKILELDRQYGMNAEETERFGWDYYESNLEVSCESQISYKEEG